MKHKIFSRVVVLFLCCSIIGGALLANGLTAQAPSLAVDASFIKWIDYTVTLSAMKDTADYDIQTHSTDHHTDWVTLLSLLASQNGGNFSSYTSAKLASITKRLEAGEKPEEIAENQKLYRYYQEAYGAILSGMIGSYTVAGDESGETYYGVRVFSPIAAGYYYNDYDDFGVSRSYGYRRHHLGHDMMGSVGTPIIAVESGVIEHLGWNQYGGWRIGIRSFDGKRYYYYAHLRRGNPYAAGLYEGMSVCAGEVIGFLGMTGYSIKENVNNINTPHLHFGLQIIFDASQIEGWNQIWIDLYTITAFLSHYRAPVEGKDTNGNRISGKVYIYPETPD